MKKRILAFLTALCMLLSTTGALAESAAYTPGQTTFALFESAWNAGEIITADIGLNVDLNLDALGVAGEEAAIVEGVVAMLQGATISVGAGRTENGVRIELGGTLVNEANESASIEVSAEMTRDGLSIESDLIPGQKITAAWETLLALCGASEAEIAQIMSIRDMDVNALIEQLKAQLPVLLESAMAVAAPYGETISAFLNTLSFEEITDVPEQEGYPAVAALGRVTFTPKDLAPLFTALADQLEQDATLSPLLDSLLAELASSPATTAEFCAAMREFAASITNETPFVLDVGVSENGEVLYIEFYDAPATGSTGYLGLFAYPTGEPNAYSYWLGFSSYPDGATIENAFYMGFDMTMDPADPLVFDMTMDMGMTAEGQNILTANASVANQAITTDEGMPGYSSTMQMTENMDIEGDQVRALVSTQEVWAQTANAGEAFALQGTFDYYFPDMSFTLNAFEEGMFTPDGSGVDGAMKAGLQMPDFGVNAISMSVGIRSEAHTPAQLTQLALETVSSEQMTELENAVMNALYAKTLDAMAVIPPELLALMTAAE